MFMISSMLRAQESPETYKAIVVAHNSRKPWRPHVATTWGSILTMQVLDDLTQFIGAALNAGDAAIVVATESHRDSFFLRLQAHGLDIRIAIEQRKYFTFDAAETLSTFMFNGMPDEVRFMKLG